MLFQVAESSNVKESTEKDRSHLLRRVHDGEKEIRLVVAKMTGAAHNESDWTEKLTGKLRGHGQRSRSQLLFKLAGTGNM